MSHEGLAIRIFADPMAQSRFAADRILALAREAVELRHRFHFVLSGGSTPEPLLAILADQPYQAILPWQDTHIFWGDERCVPPEAEGSNFGQAQRLLLSHVPLRAENIHRIVGELPPEKAAADYRGQLLAFAEGGLAWPRFDVVLLGLGGDGHTASLFPGLLPQEAGGLAAIAVKADYQGRPAERVTLTPPVFNNARQIIFLVNGAAKAGAVKATLEGATDIPRWPAQRIRPSSGQVLWLLDKAAAGDLELGRYSP